MRIWRSNCNNCGSLYFYTKKETWKLAVRCERLWMTYSRYNPKEIRTMEVVLIDDNSDKIQGHIKKFQVPKMEKIFKEGGFYVVSNFGIAQNNDDFIATSHTYLLEFHKFTSVRSLHNLPSIPMYGFNFVEFSDIRGDRRYEKLFVDVIAQVHACEDIVEIERYGVLTKRVTVYLRNTSGEKMECTLWNTYAEQMVNFWQSDVQGPVIIVLQYAMVKEYQGVKYLQNSLYASRLILNGDICESVEYMKSIEKVSVETGPRTLMRKDSSSHGSELVKEDLLNLEFKNIDELDSISEECSFIVLGTIQSLQTTYGWYYNACMKCSKKVTGEDNFFKCAVCKSDEPLVVTKFKVTVRVKDGSAASSFVLFDPQVQNILGKSAAELKRGLDLCGDYDGFPEELDELVRRTFLFKLDVKKYTLQCKQNRVYTVGKLTSEEKVIGDYLSKQFVMKENEESTISSIGESVINSEFATPSSKESNKRTCVGVTIAEKIEDEFGTQISSTKPNANSKKLKSTK